MTMSYRGALVFMSIPAMVPNSYNSAQYVLPQFDVVERDTDTLFDADLKDQFIIGPGISKVRLFASGIWEGCPVGSRQIVILRDRALYSLKTPDNRLAIPGTTTDHGVFTHVLDVQEGDTFQLAFWQQQPSEAGPAIQLYTCSFEIDVVDGGVDFESRLSSLEGWARSAGEQI